MGDDGRVDVVEVRGSADGGDHGGAGPVGELGGQGADAAENSVDQNQSAVDRAVGEDGAVGGDAGDAEARPQLVTEVVGQRCGLVVGYDGVLGGGAEGAVGLGAVYPDPLSDAVDVDLGAHGVDDSGGVAVRDHPREGHGRAEPAAPFLGVAGVDARDGDADADLAGAGDGIREFADVQDIGGGSLVVVPGSKHGGTSVGSQLAGAAGACGSLSVHAVSNAGSSSPRVSRSQVRSARLVARAVSSMPRR